MPTYLPTYLLSIPVSLTLSLNIPINLPPKPPNTTLCTKPSTCIKLSLYLPFNLNSLLCIPV